MLWQEKRTLLRFKLAVAAIAMLVSSITVLAISHRALSSRAARTQNRQPVVSAVPLPVALVPAGLPATLANAAATVESDGSRKSQIVTSINVQAASLNAEKLTQLNLVVLEFDERGGLRRVDGFARAVDLGTGKTVSVTLPVERRVRLGHRLALAVERAGSAAKRWEADLDALARNVATALAGNPAVTVTARNEAPLSADTGAALCANGMRHANLLAQAGDRSGLTSYTCNQSEGAFTLSFNGKNLF
jgi:hypothetical protein